MCFLFGGGFIHTKQKAYDFPFFSSFLFRSTSCGHGLGILLHCQRRGVRGRGIWIGRETSWYMVSGVPFVGFSWQVVQKGVLGLS